MMRRRSLVVSDLDGTLLDHDTYSSEAVRPALDRLREAGVAIVLVSSKTRAEIEAVQEDLGVDGPFVAENGGGLFFAAGSVPGGGWRLARRGGYDLIELGLPYDEVVARLRAAAGSARVRIRGFADMTAAEVAADSGLGLPRARLAKRREFGEPFRILDATAGAETALVRACEALGLTVTRGGRYHHAGGRHDKGAAVRVLRQVLDEAGTSPFLVGFGDGLNDAGMLAEVDLPVIVRGRDAGATDELRRLLPQALVTTEPGPAGVAAAVLADVPSRLRASHPDVAWPGGESRRRAGQESH